MLDTVAAALAARGQAPLAGYLGRFQAEYAPRLTLLALVLTLAGLAAGLAWVRGAPGPAAGPSGWTGPAGRRLRAWLCIGAALVAWAFHAAVLGPIPREPDEATYLFEARLLAAGRAVAPDPGAEIRGLVDLPFSAAAKGRWFGAFPPGWPAVLGVADTLGLAGVINPFLLALNLWLIGLWVERHWDEEAATAAVVLGAVSPFLLVLHGTLMADPLGLTLLLATLHACEANRAAGAGAAAGLAMLVRPASAFAAFPMLAWALLQAGERRGRTRAALASAAGATPALLALLVWNRAATGAAFDFAYLAAAPPFGPGAIRYQGLTLQHDGVAAVVNLGMNLLALSTDLFGLGGLSLVAVLAGASAAWAGARRGPGPWVLAGMLVGHGLYFHPGIAYGPRFYLPLAPWILAAAALGCRGLAAAAGRSLAEGLPRLGAALLPAALLGWWLPAAGQLARHGGIDPLPLSVADARMPGQGRLLVFVPAVGYPERPLDRAFLGRLDPMLARRDVYLRDPGDAALRARLAASLGREPWLLPWP